jgi:MFS family permease
LEAEIFMIPTGALSISFITTANSFLQTHSTQEMRGRVMSLYALAWLGTTPIGAPLTGLVIHFTNPRVGIFMGAVVTLLTGAFLLWVSLRHRDLENSGGAILV